jgi:hypothetical protein
MFINERLLNLVSAKDLLIIHPHAQRTGGGTFRNHVLAKVFGRHEVYSRMFVRDAKDWRFLKQADLEGYRAYTDLTNYRDIGLTRPHVAVALMRDPVYRAVSLYYFARRKLAHRNHDQAMSMGLEEFFQRVAPLDSNYFINVQCRRACGYSDSHLALKYLQSKFIAVGFTNELSRFAGALSEVFGWRPLDIHDEQNDAEKYARDVTPSFRALIRKQNAEDVALFDAMANGPPYRIAPRFVGYEVRRAASTAIRRAHSLVCKSI